MEILFTGMFLWLKYKMSARANNEMIGRVQSLWVFVNQKSKMTSSATAGQILIRNLWINFEENLE